MQPISLTTEAIQSLLDENEALLQAILSNQNQGKLDACVAIQQKLQQNLSMLATVADQQPNRQMQQMAQNRGMGASTPTPIVPLQGQGLPHPSPLSDTDRKENRFWTDDEHQRFLEGLRLYTENNKPDLKAIASHVGSRTVPQVRSHHQKYLLKQQRHASSPKPSK